MTTVFTDGDSIYFRVACVTKDHDDIRKSIDGTLTDIMNEAFSDVMDVAVKGKNNFRYDIFPKYKSNRKELAPDLKAALQYGYEYMIDAWEAVPAHGMEADDLVAIWAHTSMAAKEDYAIAGIDKDLKQIPGNHYNFVKKTWLNMSTSEAYKSLMLQCLTGDATDGIPGIRGIGPKKAAKILLEIGSDKQWGIVQNTWKEHNAGSPEITKNLVRMLTTWDEYEAIKLKIESKAAKREQHVLAERQTPCQDRGVSTISK